MGGLAYLHCLQVIAVVTQHSGQLDSSDLRQLLQSEGGWPATILIPEPVSGSEVVELFANDTGQGGADHAAGQRSLSDAGRPQVQIVRRGVELGESLDTVVGHVQSKVIPGPHGGQATELSPPDKNILIDFIEKYS